MNIRNIISSIALGAGLAIISLAPLQAQAGDHRYIRHGDHHQQRDRQHDRGDRYSYRNDYRDRRHNKHRNKRHNDRYHHSYGHYYDRHARKHAYKHARKHRHHGYTSVCHLPKHRHHGRHGHYPRGYSDGNLHGRVGYNDPDGWGLVFKF